MRPRHRGERIPEGGQVLTDPYIRWGSSETITVVAGASAFGQQPNATSALVFLTRSAPEVHSLLLFAKLSRKLGAGPPPEEIQVNWEINVGCGNANLDLGGPIVAPLTLDIDPGFVFLFSANIATPTEDYQRLTTGYQEAFRLITVPCQKLQASASVSGVLLADCTLDVGITIAPRFNLEGQPQ